METGKPPWSDVERSSSKQDFVQLAEKIRPCRREQAGAVENYRNYATRGDTIELREQMRSDGLHRSRRTRYEKVRLLSSTEPGESLQIELRAADFTPRQRL